MIGWKFFLEILMATPFPALSIMMIFPDKCQTKSFEDHYKHFNPSKSQILYHQSNFRKRKNLIVKRINLHFL